MATGKADADPTNQTRHFVVGLVIGLVAMVAVAMVTLFELGYWPPERAEEIRAPHVFTADDLEPAPKPTAVWRFRSEWLTPRAK